MSPGYFDVFRIPILRGRDFTDRDCRRRAASSSSTRRWREDSGRKGDPLSDQIVIGKGVGAAFEEGPRQIIGSSGDVRDGALNQEPAAGDVRAVSRRCPTASPRSTRG
jgi:hypothetical protein